MTELVDYDSSWPAVFEDAADQLRSVGDPEWLIEHIGSTSIAGLTAKPIIDLAVRVPSFDDLDHRRSALADGGWLELRRQPRSHRVRVRERNGRRTHIAHFFTGDQWDSCHQRLFRDWLREHPEDLARYRDAKLRAATNSGADYTRAKQPVVLGIVNQARAARGLPMIDDLDPDEAR